MSGSLRPTQRKTKEQKRASAQGAVVREFRDLEFRMCSFSIIRVLGVSVGILSRFDFGAMLTQKKSMFWVSRREDHESSLFIHTTPSAPTPNSFRSRPAQLSRSLHTENRPKH